MTEMESRYEERVNAYVLGELSAEETRDFERACLESDLLRLKVYEARSALERLEDEDPAFACRDLTNDILERIENEERSARVIPWPARVVVRAAAAVLLLLGGVYLLVALRGEGEATTRVAAADPSIPMPAAHREAVDRALDWLARSQSSSGAWETGNDGGRNEAGVDVTAVAVLALLELDEEPWSGSHAESLRRGVAYLLDRYSADSRAGVSRTRPLMMLVLAEASRGCPDRALKEPLRRALAAISAERGYPAGWDYAHDAGPVTETRLASLTEELADRSGDLLAMQVAEGPLGGSWDLAVRHREQGGRVYSTAVAALALGGRQDLLAAALKLL